VVLGVALCRQTLSAMPQPVFGNSMHKFVISLIAFVLLSCSDQGLSPQDRDFNILLRFGVNGRNELNTFENTYTKDLILDGTITVSLVLSDSELQAIKERLIETGFFSYPDTLPVSPADSFLAAIEPHASNQIRVKNQSIVKTVFWNDTIVPSYTDIRR
jgi:hypothetical protein